MQSSRVHQIDHDTYDDINQNMFSKMAKCVSSF